MDNRSYIPSQKEGQQTDTVAERVLDDLQTAQFYFNIAKHRLLDVNNWHQIGKIEASVFCLVNERGDKVDSLASVGNYFKIDIPGPGSKAGDGYDWVKIESIQEIKNEGLDKEALIMKVRPASNPQNDVDDVAHFLKSEATSTFIVARQGNKIAAEVHGRNELPNSSVASLIDKVRNTLIGIGAILGISILQWKLLTEGITSLTPNENDPS
jgi:hypothetical protein